MFIYASLIVQLILLIPVWFIFKKAGFHPALALLMFVPYLGVAAVYCILAFAKWPAFER